jgi:hypothetical protein
LRIRLKLLRGAALAFLCGVAVCPQGGCLIPQSIDPITQSPHSPPHFVVEKIQSYLLPPVLTLVRQGTADAAQNPPCHCRLLFDGLVVAEEDATITLEARWFIDYNPAIASSTLVWQRETLAGNFDDATATERPLQTFRFDADDVGIVASGVHVVEVVVGESEGFDPSSTTQPNRAMKPGYTPALYRFVVDARLEPIVGQCPQTPPSDRVCQ